jgi:hypothetical protein
MMVFLNLYPHSCQNQNTAKGANLKSKLQKPKPLKIYKDPDYGILK